jgi:hypothetical protein
VKGRRAGPRVRRSRSAIFSTTHLLAESLCGRSRPRIIISPESSRIMLSRIPRSHSH